VFFSPNQSLASITHDLVAATDETFQVFEDYLKVIFLLMLPISSPSQHDETSHQDRGSFCQGLQFASLYQQPVVQSHLSIEPWYF
jgi:hypothetical protein